PFLEAARRAAADRGRRGERQPSAAGRGAGHGPRDARGPLRGPAQLDRGGPRRGRRGGGDRAEPGPAEGRVPPDPGGPARGPRDLPTPGARDAQVGVAVPGGPGPVRDVRGAGAAWMSPARQRDEVRIGLARRSAEAPMRYPSWPIVVVAPLLVASLLLPARAAAEGADLSGRWVINRKPSDDGAAKVAEAAGPDTMTGAETIGGVTFLPHSSQKSEVDRVNLRQFLLDTVASLERVEIEQTADEVKTIHADDQVRIFNLTRESTGANAAGGKLTRRASWKGQQLVLESTSGKTKLTELLPLVPTRNQLIHAIHYEAELFKKPLDLRLVYERAPSSKP